MIQVDDLSRSLIAFEQISTLVIVVELSQSSWLAAGVVPGIERRPLKKLDPDPTALLHLVEGWRDRATKAGRAITRTVLAFESGRDGFWLARSLRVRGVETFVMHSTSVAVSREPRRAKTDRLDTEMLIRVFLGWLRGEPRHCKMVAIPTLEEEDARRPSRERESLVGERTRIINRMKAALVRLGIRGFKPGLLTAPQKLDAYSRGDANSAQHVAGSAGALGTGACHWPTCDGSDVGARYRRRRRDGGYAGARSSVQKPARPTGRGPLRRPHRVARRERVETT